ncbi:MAG: ATP-binding cassette domain-containing protein [Alphaproteobacteria bacterium]|nr:ATP-binding cassette domain-containing protein [Alphaproteobacteria bacterium]
MTRDSNPGVEIRIEGLCRAFDGRPVLQGVDLDIKTGSFTAIVGGSGSGKTVLLNHILGLLKPDSGRVLVAFPGDSRPTALVDLAGLDVAKLDELHTHWGVVFQRNALFSGSVLDNIALWLDEVRHLNESEIAAIAAQVLASVGLPTDQDFQDSPVESLSGGMAKRIAIARSLAMKPQCIFFDEPTTGLDPVNASQIQDLLLSTHYDQEAGGQPRTTVIITHDKDLLIRLKPRVVMLHEGKVSFNGFFDDFMASHSPIIRPYFDLMPVLHQRGGGRV